MLPTTNNFFSTIVPPASAAWPVRWERIIAPDFQVAMEAGRRV